MSIITEIVKQHIQGCHECYVNRSEVDVFKRSDERQAIERKHKNLEKRKAEIVKNIVDGSIIKEHSYDNKSIIDYGVTVQHVIKQHQHFYMEEQVQLRRAILEEEKIVDDYQLNREGVRHNENTPKMKQIFNERVRGALTYQYDRLAVVKYAERWWNDYNPEYKHFENDCTNYISQCISAGGATMSGFPDRSNGWWYQNNQWSYSWSVAHALRWYLSGAKDGLHAKEVYDPKRLLKGDIICYDFNGDDQWQHTTVVVAKDADGMPLVNAHTTNSRMRYWSYEDSTAWTPNIKYKFFHILDRE
ncbi:amidase domain-containing protein [Evansella cellulosilytica]|uniref:Putative amidase domain-containing protein n=1 Tax=Evansella cellulosilytica (strain ATCC 21833 / DSM 2522 / FERM P-1141 / JCM 9156 / N-4) TaxID=649639 RepID=E6TTI5_EVAC2|nr:amidase domain-containing protein [Evansella cellulosilytica]ADU29621.1 hypothetical protein Bcell_1356 [Evansella cellulosilytica DSM 2522]